MPYPFNNVATTDAYGDTTTTVFPFARSSFTVQVYGQGVGYRLLYVPGSNPRTNQYNTDNYEHFLGPAFAAFDEADLPPGAGMLFAGIMFRSWVAGNPANVTVL